MWDTPIEGNCPLVKLLHGGQKVVSVLDNITPVVPIKIHALLVMYTVESQLIQPKSGWAVNRKIPYMGRKLRATPNFLRMCAYSLQIAHHQNGFQFRTSPSCSSSPQEDPEIGRGCREQNCSWRGMWSLLLQPDRQFENPAVVLYEFVLFLQVIQRPANAIKEMLENRQSGTL